MLEHIEMRRFLRIVKFYDHLHFMHLFTELNYEKCQACKAFSVKVNKQEIDLITDSDT